MVGSLHLYVRLLVIPHARRRGAYVVQVFMFAGEHTSSHEQHETRKNKKCLLYARTMALATSSLADNLTSHLRMLNHLLYLDRNYRSILRNIIHRDLHRAHYQRPHYSVQSERTEKQILLDHLQHGLKELPFRSHFESPRTPCVRPAL